ncbi:MAG: TRAP transporter small permease, partial [Ramlibacter sp.]
MSTFFDWTDRAIGMVCRGVLYVTLSVTFFILSVNVGLRYAMGSSLAWASELPELLFPWMIMAGVVLAAQSGSHIAVVILTQKLGAARRWVLAAGSLVVAGLYLGLCWATWP